MAHFQASGIDTHVMGVADYIWGSWDVWPVGWRIVVCWVWRPLVLGFLYTRWR